MATDWFLFSWKIQFRFIRLHFAVNGGKLDGWRVYRYIRLGAL